MKLQVASELEDLQMGPFDHLFQNNSLGLNFFPRDAKVVNATVGMSLCMEIFQGVPH